MSFGYPNRTIDGYSDLEQAIQNAYHARVLLFAAASSSGANLRRAFPARHDEVICIHSTDAYGNRSKFSPNAQIGDTFATIGEAVTSAWPVHLCGPEASSMHTMPKSGTSIATPIAAGIAAFLLLYTRLHLGEDAVSMLKRSSAMKALLRKIATKGVEYEKRDGYDYVEISGSPDNLFGKEEAYIVGEIMDALR